jgi:ferredoxin-NADP reductase
MQARLIESIEIAPEVRHFVFEAPDLKRIEFTPGQFVSFTGDVKGKKITRAYSIASPPGDNNRFGLCLNLVKDGVFSPHLFQMKPGDVVEMLPPLGQFVLRHLDRDAILVATGTGIAPFRSILHGHLNEKSAAFDLIFGVRHQHSLMYKTEFEEMARLFPHFRFTPTLTLPDASWTGSTGRVQTHLTEAIRDRRDVDFYLCGLKAMVDDVRLILKQMGFDRKQIIYEKYD